MAKPADRLPGARAPRDRGVALLLALTVILILVGLTVEANRQVRSMVTAAHATRERQKLGWIARSGVVAAAAILAEDKRNTKVDTIQEDWAQKEKINQVLAEMGLGNAGLTVSIQDCLSRIQVNALVKPPDGQQFNAAQEKLWDNFLRPIISEHEMTDLNATTDFINSLKDWLDDNDDDATTGVNGAESDYYESLDPPYRARNGYLVQAEELLLVKGMTPEIWAGTEEITPVAPFITVYGATPTEDKKNMEYVGKINLGTAPIPVIKALLPTEDEDLAESMAGYREERDGESFANDITDAGWYKNAPGCSDVAIDADLLATASDFFEILSVAESAMGRRAITAVVERVKDKKSGKWTVKMLDYRVE